MTRLLLIASVLFLSINIVKCDKLSPSETLNYFCPCRSGSTCTTTFGDPGPVFQDILKVIPTCTGTRLRCCSKDVLFTAIMIILNDREIEKDDDGTIEVESKDGQKQKFLASGVPAQLNGKGRFFGNFEKELVKTPKDPIAPAAAKSRFLGALTGRSNKNLPQGLVCVPLHQCGNVYGTNGQHVLKFGFISPIETGCLANAGNILCVMENGEGTTPATPPAFSTVPAGRNEFAAFSFASNGNGDIVSSVNNNGNVVNSVSVGQEELPCTLPKDCLNIYGTDGSHFDRYEIQQSCPRGDQVRCVQSPSSQPKPVLPSFPQLPLIPGLPAIPSFPGLPGLSIPVFVPPTTPPQVPTSPEIPAATGVHGAHGHHIHLPCVPQQECQVIYGTLGDHFNTYGVQQACKRDSFVRCITIKEEETPSESVGSGGHGHTHGNNQPLPCVPQIECKEIYGVLGTHFDTFGIQQGCPGDHLVRCVQVGGGNTPPVTKPTPPITHPTPPITHPTPPITLPTRPVTAPSYGGGLPVGPVAPSVSIIGPQPIYVSYNNIKGPTVGSDHSLASDGQVDSSGINSSQESQINLLLRGLKEKLKNILHG